MRSRRTLHQSIALLVALVVALPLAGHAGAAADEVPGRSRPAVSKAKPVAVTPIRARRAPTSKVQVDSAARARQLQARAVIWPRTGRIVVGGTQPARRTIGSVAAASLRGAGGAEVEVLDQSVSRKVGLAGVLVKLTPMHPGSQGAFEISANYAQFAHAYGGDWAGRLQVQAYPACLIATPHKAACQKATAVRWKNNRSRSTITSTIPANRTGQTPVLAVSAVAASASGTGDFSATPLAPSSTWTAGGSSGDFAWKYPLRAIPSNNGPAPDLNLTYSSQSVDGRTASTNNQSSMIGEGFDLSSSFIERDYATCKDDGQAGKYDLCWKTDNAMLTLNGVSNELVKAPDGTWRLTKDDGTRIRRLTSTSTYNLDNDKESWEVTVADGTKYYFGKTTSSGQAGDTKSVWYVPVFGDDSGEPCYNATFASASCLQAWRWNLDYVVDPNGNAMSLWYTAEENYYAKNKVASPGVKYVRGGRLDRIDYGLRDGATNTNPPFRTTFTYGLRCFDTATNCATYSKSKWPDTPYDQICNSGAACTSKFAPTFFTRFRLTAVTTSIRKSAAYSNVESWTFNQQFLNPGTAADGSLWLKGITHSGLAGGTATLPDLTFTPVQLTNRVDNSSDGLDPLPRYRVKTITSESGALTTINYSGEDCTPTNKPSSPDNNTMRCFPQRWTPEGNTSPRTDWFHRYVVDSVSDADMTALSPTVTTFYTYLGGAAWAYDDNKLVADDYRTWSSWRGYQQVKTVTGTPGFTDKQSQQIVTYFRGIDGDKQSSGTPRSVSVAASDGSKVIDRRELAGTERESVSYAEAGGSELSGSITTPWVKVTAGSGQKTAAFVRTAQVEARSLLSDGTWRRRSVTNTYDSNTAQPTRVSDTGDASDPNDQTCTATTYVDTMTASGAWKIGYPSRIVTSQGLCGTDALSPAESKVLTDVRKRYDNLAQGVAPTKGLLTEVDRLMSYSGTTPQYQLTSKTTYDAWGRPTVITEPSGASDTATRTRTTAYTMSTDGTLVGVTETEDSGGKAFASTKVVSPEWNVPTKITDQNSKVTAAAYDPLGRIVSVWKANRASTATPSVIYAYSISKTAATAVTTSVLDKEGTGYLSSVAIYDSLLRPRQTQAPSPNGGRIISGSAYDGRGLVTQTVREVYAAGAPAPALVQFDDGVVPALTKTTYDGQSRVTKATLYTFNSARWSTTTAYEGVDKTTVTPPNGAPSTTNFTDVRDQTVRSIEAGTPNLVTITSYDLRGNVTGITGPGGTWTYRYDLRNRMFDSDDPDAGHTTRTYTENDLLKTTTDANNKTLLTTYDNLDRKIALYEGAVPDSTKQLAGWTYDTPAKGYPATETRYVGGSAGDKFTSTIAAYNAMYRPTDSRFSVTKSTGTQLLQALPGNINLTKTSVFNVDQSIDVDYLPKVTVGTQTALSAEAVQYGYNSVGLPDSITGRTGILQDAVYDQLGQIQQYVLGTGSAAQIFVNNYYDPGTNRLTRSLVVPSTSSQVISDRKYTYDDAGDPLKESDTAVGDTQCFRYDDHRRLSEAWTPSADDCATNPSQPGLGGPAPYWQSWTYGTTGLRATQTDRTASTSQLDTYNYPAPGQPHANFADSITRTGGSPATRPYGRDSAGNTTSRPGPGTSGQQTLEWDSEGNLAKLTSASGAVTRYVYGADGNLLVRDDADATTLIIGETEIRISKSNGQATATRSYATLDGSSATRSSDSKIDFLVSDLHGTAVTAIDGTTLVSTRRFQTPFGGLRGSAPISWPNDRGFLDKVDDPSTGLTSVGAREYDASTGRFISVDPVLDASSPRQMLGYSYAGNNPKAFSDPSGLMFADIGGGGGGSTPPCNCSSANAVEYSMSQNHSTAYDLHNSVVVYVYVGVSTAAPKPSKKNWKDKLGDWMGGLAGKSPREIQTDIGTGMITGTGDLVDMVIDAKWRDYPDGWLGTRLDNFFNANGYSGSWYDIGRFFGPPLPGLGGAGAAVKAARAAERAVLVAEDAARVARASGKVADLAKAGSAASKMLDSLGIPGKTAGVLELDGKMIPLMSGKRILENYLISGHVEGQAALMMRERGVMHATLLIDNASGICGFCLNQVSTLLPEGAVLEVRVPAGTVPKNRWGNARSFEGNAASPKPLPQ